MSSPIALMFMCAVKGAIPRVPTPFVQKYTVRPFACQSSPTPIRVARDAALANLRVEIGRGPRHADLAHRRRWHRHCRSRLWRCCASPRLRCAPGARRGAGGGPRAAGGRFESDHRRGDVAIITTPGRNPRKHWSDPVYRRSVIGRRGLSAAASRGRVGPGCARGRGVPGRLRATTTGRPPRDWSGANHSGPARRAGSSRSGSSSREWHLVERARGSARLLGGRGTSSFARRGVRLPRRHHGFRAGMRESRSARGGGSSTSGSRSSSRRRGGPTPRAGER